MLYPVAGHFMGSGFYATDYGRGGKRRDGADGDGAAPGSDATTGDSKPAKTENADKPPKADKPAKAET